MGRNGDPRARTLLPGADRLRAELGIDPNRPLIVAGSTAPIDGGSERTDAFSCEEALLHAACPPGVQLLCAPRKPENFEAAFAALGGPGRCVRRSARAAAPAGTDRFLLDTIGELRQAYALADVAVIGRTFGALGGSDPIEPISLGKPTLVGPRFTNFEFVVREFDRAGALVITQPADVGALLQCLLGDPARRAALAARGAACIRQHQGATRRHAELILQSLKPMHSTDSREASAVVPAA